MANNFFIICFQACIINVVHSSSYAPKLAIFRTCDDNIRKVDTGMSSDPHSILSLFILNGPYSLETSSNPSKGIDPLLSHSTKSHNVPNLRQTQPGYYHGTFYAADLHNGEISPKSKTLGLESAVLPSFVRRENLDGSCNTQCNGYESRCRQGGSVSSSSYKSKPRCYLESSRLGSGPSSNRSANSRSDSLYGGFGNGAVLISGKLPVTGATTVAGQVPIAGGVKFNGFIPAAGRVAIGGSCFCGPPFVT